MGLDRVLAQARWDRAHAFRQLPSTYRGIEEKKRSITGIGFTIHDFGLDSSQVLLIIAEKL